MSYLLAWPRHTGEFPFCYVSVQAVNGGIHSIVGQDLSSILRILGQRPLQYHLYLQLELTLNTHGINGLCGLTLPA
jgi:hypothetical protein